MTNPILKRVMVLALAVAPTAWAQTLVFINEIHYDNTGTDTGEAVEITGPAGTDLSGWNVVLYNGNGSASYDTDPLPTPIPDAGNGFGFVTVTYPSNGIQNGSPDGIALVDKDGVVIQFLCYEGTFTAVGGPANGQTCTDIGAAETGSEAVGMSLQLNGTGSVAEDFTWAAPQAATFGTVNTDQTFTGGTGGDVAPTVVSTVPSDGADNVPINTHPAVTFSEPVTLALDALQLVCDGTPVPFSVDEGPITFNIDPNFTSDPNIDLPAGAMCTITVAAAGVTDQDGDPNNLAVDFSFSFIARDPLAACAEPATAISAVQGNGAASPFVGQMVTVQGVVVGDFQGTGQFNGYFIEEETPDQDADPTTSEGLFVNSTSAINVGDVVRVTGSVAESFNRTQLNSVSETIICANGMSVPPTEVTLPFDLATNNAEWFEGMLVTLPQTLTATEVFTLARFGEVSVSSGERLRTPTHVALPGTAANAVAAANDLNHIIIDDGLNTQNPATVRYPEPAGLSAGNTLRLGATVTDAAGVMDFAFSAYRLQPTEPVNFVPENQRPPMPELPARGPLGGEVRVASFNVLNYFNTFDEPGAQCFPSNDRSQCRGADSAAEFTRQRDKTIAAIRGLNADIVGLIEMENDGFGPDNAIQDLVNGLNTFDGTGAWAFVNPFPGAPQPAFQGGDAIKVALIYRTAVAAPVGSAAILDNSVDIRVIDTKNRAPLAQTFRSLRTNDRFTVVINHFKSKGSDCNVAVEPGELNDPDVGDEQGNCNLTRLSLANALIDWLATDPTGSNDPDFISVGDLNAYRMEDPIRALIDADYTDMITALNGDDLYSFVFQGESGYLDHALADIALRPQINAVTEWHINADEPVALDYNVEFKSPEQVLSFYAPDAFRAADHDPVIVQMMTAGDLDGDRDVDGQDRLVLSRTLGARSGTKRYIAEADYNNDGRVGFDDVVRWTHFLRAYRAAVRAAG